MPLSGHKLGPYEILSPLGKGGMGEVWRARDSRLGRDVAIKVADHRFSNRFEREARAIAALNHPNTCTVYDVGPNYLVMEVVEGPTLAERIRRGPIPLDDALALARQIAYALDAARWASSIEISNLPTLKSARTVPSKSSTSDSPNATPIRQPSLPIRRPC